MKIDTNFLKTSCVFLLLLLPFGASSQDAFTFPETFFAHPEAHEMRFLKVKKIEQLHTSICRNKEDSTKLDSLTQFEYIVTYNDEGRIASFKHDFKKEYGIEIFSDLEGNYTRYSHNDSSRLEVTISGSDTTYYNSVENVFIYDLNRLERIEIKRPYRGGIIDGVFIRKEPKKEVIVKDTYENELLMERNTFVNGELLSTLTFEYKRYEYKSAILYLTHKVTRKGANYSDFYTINYEL
jgi:hypothetical protein